MRDILITLGSNINPEENITAAIQALDEEFGVLAKSRCYRTPAVGLDGSLNPTREDFINAAVQIADRGLNAMELRSELRAIEVRLGRVRTEDKFAPRTIDMDIALLGEEIHRDDHGKIKIPDPDIMTRAHTALTLADIAPDHLIPGQDCTLGENAKHFEIEERFDCDV